ncbi:hypothetical protein G5B37_12275 [Rasiella rasia]|uniref:Lipoprotein n=1 Tax=Rasiella rasia TaxID=2744027 RepID=A0A6G6GP27_9FLAO|nr:hypothetical protein [Rasiella rasia]QIE60309.1 hypothetical protein G5B37_12275 [Rasiella rasia]
MRNFITSITLILLLISCDNAGKKTEENVKQESKVSSTTKKEESIKDDKTYLCKINGEDWYYDRSSTMITKRNRNKDSLNYRLLFIKEKDAQSGKKTLSLIIDANSLKLSSLSFKAEIKNNEGKPIYASYLYTKTSENEAVTEDFNFVVKDNIISGSGSATGKIVGNKFTLMEDKIDPEKYLLAKVTDFQMKDIKIEDPQAQLKELFNK